MAFASKEKAIAAIRKRPITSPMFDNFREDLDFARTVLEYNLSYIKYLGERIKKNYGFATIVCSQVPWYIEYFEDSIKNDAIFVKEVILKKLNDKNTYAGGVEAFRTNHHSIVMPILTRVERMLTNNVATIDKDKTQELFARRVYLAMGQELRKRISELPSISLNGNTLQSLNEAIYILCEKTELKNTLQKELSKKEETVKQKRVKI